MIKVHPAALIFPPLDQNQLEALSDDIAANGQRETIKIYEGKILDGRNRYAACFDAGIEPILEYLTGDIDPIAYVISLNLHRRHLNESQRAMVAAKIATMVRGDNQHTQICGTSQPAAAEMLNVSTRAVQHAASVQSTGTPALQKAVEGGVVAVSTASEIASLPEVEQDLVVARGEKEILAKAKEIKAAKQQAKQEARADLADKLNNEPIPLPVGPFRVIVLDPPWMYESRKEDVTHRGRNQYPDMTQEEICALPVADLAHDDCVVWLWTTNAFMRDAYECLDVWGFQCKTILTWDKVNLGLGDYLRNVTEHCLLATRGRPTLVLTNQTTMIREVRREHSRKPEAFYDLVESLCPGSKLEMFSRTPRNGWQQWGAETNAFV